MKHTWRKRKRRKLVDAGRGAIAASLNLVRLRIEPLEERHLLAADFGDAPLPYRTLLAEDGARHEAIGPTLGGARDEEADGVHSADASADGADEDGVIFGAVQVGQLDATVTVNVQGGDARLDAWIDFNHDGSWGGPGEQIADSWAVTAGDNVITFDVPSWAVDGQTFARFRLSTAGNLSIGGATTDGEVEDLQLSISPPMATGHTFSGEGVISTQDGVYFYTADLNGDGHLDLLSGSLSTNNIIAFEGDGRGHFVRHSIAVGFGRTVAVDMDSDNDLDVVGFGKLLGNERMVWFENAGTWSFTAHDIGPLDPSYGGGIAAVDIDSDGDVDVVGTGDSTLVLYENDGNQLFSPYLIASEVSVDSAPHAIDMDHDGDLDLLASNGLTWCENDGDHSFNSHLITSDSHAGSSTTVPLDMDADGDMDVLNTLYVPGVGTKLVWYENDGEQTFTQREVAQAGNSPYVFAAGDVDGDGDMDVAGHLSGRVVVYVNNGAQHFAEVTLYNGFFDPWLIDISDVDGDQDLDIVATYLDYDDDPIVKIAWFANQQDDFGDAPAPYPTTFARQGASHTAVGSTLGATRDQELDGQPSANADADGADDDGVTFGQMRVGQLGAELVVNVQGGPARLDAWVDFNGDGTWGSAGEQIADNLPVEVGDNTITFSVPAWAASGQTYARFRVSTQGNLAVDGHAADGEVEDYAVSIVPPVATPGGFGNEQVIGEGVSRDIVAIDFDRDGDLDVVSALRDPNRIVWYENDGSQAFTMHVIDEGIEYLVSLAVSDIDGDGDSDLFARAELSSVLYWYESDGGSSFVKHEIPTPVPAAFDDRVRATDLDGDGDVDAVLSFFDNGLSWIENRGNGAFLSHTVTSGIRTYAPKVADVDGDGDIDIVTGAYENPSSLIWHENRGGGTFVTRSLSTISTFWLGVVAADMDGDGDTDIAATSYYDASVYLFENTGSSFQSRVLPQVEDEPGGIVVGDTDGDGDYDLLTSSFFYNRVVTVYDNLGTDGYQPHVAAQSALVNEGRAIDLGDMDGDGDLDLIWASSDMAGISWYENDPVASVVARKVFYNESSFDNNNSAIEPFGPTSTVDVRAVDPTKSAYLPGSGPATFANITAYDKGINGIIIDLAAGGDHELITADDFVFKVGNNNSPGLWADAPAPAALSVIPGGGDGVSDRIVITWATGAIRNTWLEVQVLADEHTGLETPDVFYWGNLVGETGNGISSTKFARTIAADGGAILAHGAASVVGVANPFDIDKNNSISAAADRGVILSLGTGWLTRIDLGTVEALCTVGEIDGDFGIASALAIRGQTAAKQENSTQPLWQRAAVELRDDRARPEAPLRQPAAVARYFASLAKESDGDVDAANHDLLHILASPLEPDVE